MANSAFGLTLTEAIDAAKIHDKAYLAAITADQTAMAQREQAASIWRPKIVLSASAGKSSHDTMINGAQFSTPQMGSASGAAFNTSVNHGNLTQWSIGAEQPLFSPAKLAQSKQLKLAAQLSQLQTQGAKQSLLLRVSEYYFDTLLAEQALKLVDAQLKAVQRTATEAKDRFDLGAMTAVDVHEANAALAELKAEQLATQTDWQIKRQRLQSSIGQEPNELTTLPEQLVREHNLSELSEWQQKAKEHSIDLKAQTLMTELAKTKANEYSTLSSVNINAVAQISRQHLSGSGDFGTASNRENTAMIGVQLSMPLYTGGYRSAKEKEALIAAEKAQLELEGKEQQIEQQVQAAWLGIKTGALRVKAFQEAKTASRLRLDSTVVGVDIGQRTIQNLLNAQNQSANIFLSAKRAQVEYFLNLLRLLALTQELDEEQIKKHILPSKKLGTE